MTTSSTATLEHELHVHPYLTYLRIYPIAVSGIGAYHIFMFLFRGSIDIFELLISIIGVSVSFFYFFKKPIYKKALHFWALGQVIYFTSPFITWNVTQLDSYSFYMYFETHSHEIYKIGLNLVGVAFLFTNFYFNHLNYIYSLVGKKVTFSPITPMVNLKDMNQLLPAHGYILKRVKIENEQNWMLVKLNELKGIDADSVYFAIRSTDKGTFRPRSNALLRILKLKDIEKVNNEQFAKSDFEYLGVAKGK
jgi:hypothetical protein